MNTTHSKDSTCRSSVRAHDGQLFPVSVRADASAGADLTDNGVMSSIAFTMRSEPGIVFTMRSEPGQVSCTGR